ncbi:stealth conserved region 3 domain-containing protein [Nocardioides aquiterrae]|uniref:Stealth conserved region 3 domain-containing protein n=1 Tax=Nocardioides aquiterrae TaxID=203799 RepID=A0ABN1UTN1_9ACTN
MKITFLLLNLDGGGGTERSVVTQANALAALGQDVTILSALRTSDRPHYDVDPAVSVRRLVDLRDPETPRTEDDVVAADLTAALAERPSLLVPDRWDAQFSALTDAMYEHVLPALDADVVVSVTPGLLAAAVQLLPRRVAIVHQEHRSSSDRTSGLEPLLTFAPRADVVALLTRSAQEWLTETLGPVAPQTVVVPNPLPQGFKPRSTLETGLIVAAGRFVAEKQMTKLIEAFGEIADRIPGWRLRILGSGPQRLDLIRLIRRLGLWDRVELPGQSADMPSEWAAASISALPSRSEGLPLVVQEAMAAGVPVIAFDNPSGSRAVIRHEVNGLLVGPDALSGLSTALLRLATDDALRHQLGEGALASSRQYAPEAIARRWLTIFEGAVERRSGDPRPLHRRVSELATTPAATADLPTAATDLTPAEARRMAVSWAVQCAARVSQRWFVVPAHGDDPATVVVPMAARSAFLTELGGPEAPDRLSLVDTAGHGWPERRDRIGRLAAELAPEHTGRVSLEPWPMLDEQWPGVLSSGCRIHVEFWESAPNGDLVSAGLNAYTNRLPADFETVEAEIEGVVARTLPLMAQPTVRDCTFPIDAVYTWVDGDDPEWNAAREARLAEVGRPLDRTAAGRARFVNRDELRYSLRSLHLFAPWIRTIHLVTAGQVPSWLVDHPQVNLVHHRDILPADALPTFNSHAIESSIHKIPGLAEHFVYLNDDFLLARPQRPQRFFDPSGHTAVFFSSHNIGIEHDGDAAPWLKAAWNNRRLLRETFGVVSTHSLAHAPYAHRRSVLEEIERRFPEEIARTARSPFRADDNISLLSSFAQHYGLATGTAVVGSSENAYVDISANDVIRKLRRLKPREQDFICLGDHHDHALTPAALKEVLDDFFTFYLPVPARWEKAE